MCLFSLFFSNNKSAYSISFFPSYSDRLDAYSTVWSTAVQGADPAFRGDVGAIQATNLLDALMGGIHCGAEPKQILF